MALDKTIIPVALGQGMDRGADPKQVQQKLLTLKNGVFTVAGAINKRTGSAVVKQAASPARFIASFKDDPTLIDDGLIKGRKAGVAQNTDAESWETITADFSLVTGTETPLAGSIAGKQYRMRSVDYVVTGDLIVLALQGDSYAAVTVIEASSGRQIDTRLLLGTSLRLTLSNTTVYYFFRDTTSGRIFAGSVGSDGTVSGDAVIANGGTYFTPNGYLFPIAHNTMSGWRITVYYWETTSLKLRGLYLNGTTYAADWDILDNVAGTAITCTATYHISAVPFSASNAVDCVLYSGHLGGATNDLRMVMVTGASQATNGPVASVVADVSCFRGAMGAARVQVLASTASGQDIIQYAIDPNTFLVTATNTLFCEARLEAGPVRVGSDYYFLASAFESASTRDAGTLYLCRSAESTAGCTIIGRCLQGVGDIDTAPIVGAITSTVSGSSVILSTVAKRYDSEVSSSAIGLTFRKAAAVSDLDAKEINGQLILPGSLPQSFDGVSVRALGQEPPILSGAANTSLSGAKSSGTYGYMAVIQWRDESGLLHCSAPSNAISVVVANPASDCVDLTIYIPPTAPPYSYAAIYATVNLGNVYYFIGKSYGTTPTGGTTRIVTMTDLLDTPTTGDIIYTQGGLLENSPAPPFSIHCVHQNRHFVVDAVNPQTRIYYSKPFEAGVAIEHSAFLTVSVPPNGGNITGLASFLDRLVVFKTDCIYVLSGEGLNNVGGGAGYSEPLKINPAIGCINHRAIVEIPDGLMFLSQNGFYLLDKSLQMRFVGKDVKSITDDATWRGLVTRGVLVPKKNYVLFVSSGSGDCTCLVYNWLFDQWGIFTNRRAYDAALVNGAYWWVSDSDTHAHLDDETVYQDAVIS